MSIYVNDELSIWKIIALRLFSNVGLESALNGIAQQIISSFIAASQCDSYTAISTHYDSRVYLGV